MAGDTRGVKVLSSVRRGQQHTYIVCGQCFCCFCPIVVVIGVIVAASEIFGQRGRAPMCERVGNRAACASAGSSFTFALITRPTSPSSSILTQLLPPHWI